MLCLLVGGRDESSEESKIRRALHREAGTLPGLHPYLRLHVRTSTAEADIQRHFRVSPPSVHQMIVTLERNGFIRRQPGVPRSIEILVPPESLPILEWLGIKTSKSLW
ncbi:LexA family protein [Bradyrhizobium barranii]|uniref:LexA family protein n=1 Tax=Bradyrhizobium barranii TaxID=2992140 RepID=UPI003CCAB1F2